MLSLFIVAIDIVLLPPKALYIPVCVVKEIYRAKKVVGGIADASKVTKGCAKYF